MDRIGRIGDFPNTFAQQGWQCPICGRVYSPTTAMCFYCGNQKTVLSTGAIIENNPYAPYGKVVLNEFETTSKKE